VDKVLPFNLFNQSDSLLEKKIGPFYNDKLNPTFWTEKKTKNGDTEWIFDQRVRKKLLRIADDFFENFGDILKKRALVDVQLSGSIANYNYSTLSDLDVNVVVNLEGINDENTKILKSAIYGIRFIWNLRHDISIRGYDVELYLQDKEEPYVSTGIFSLSDNKWIKEPIFDPPSIDDSAVEKKYQSIVYEIEQLDSRLLLLSTLPDNSKQLYKRAERLKEKIIKMRKEGLAGKGEFSIGNLTFKKLRNEGYIDKLINLISKSYDRIYTEQ
jgi:predicted nucleotidyltransferase